MKTRTHLSRSIVCLLMVLLCIVAISACVSPQEEHQHVWGEWTTTKEATCEVAGQKSHKCTICDIEESASIDLSAHNWVDATCTSPKTCSVCNKTEGSALAHIYDKDVVSDKALKSAATEESAAIYYKSCACGAISTSDQDTFTSGAPVHTHSYEKNADPLLYLAKEATCESAAEYYYSCASCGKCHDGEGAETFTDGDPLGHYYAWESNGNNTHTGACQNGCETTETKDCSGGVQGCTQKAICDACKEYYGDVLGHEWVDGKMITAPTCTTAGQQEKHCKRPGCVETTTVTLPATGHNYKASETVDPTCIAQGYTTYTCENKDCQVSYKADYTEVVDHDWNIEAPTCTEDQFCSDCKAKNEATGHDYVQSVTAATCESKQINTYTCSACYDSYEEAVGTPLAHNINGVEAELIAEGGKSCIYVEHYKCSDCGADVVGQTVEKHGKYTATITKSATCTTEGIKTLICADCGDTNEEAIPVDSTLGHTWVIGEVLNGKREDACECGATKKVTIVTEDQANKVEDLKDTELSVGGTNINFGEAADSIGNQTKNDVTVGAGTLDDATKEQIGLSPEQFGQIGNNPIYNFTVTDTDNKAITNFGEDVYVTISIPYTLSDGEDVDAIAIWFINNEGEVESIKATYNNGYVTFQTNHFSYYTVTRLTPAERCAVYGHNFKTSVVAPTCTEQGYTLQYCIRCRHSEKVDLQPALEHNYTTTVRQEVTCTQAGVVLHTCSNCRDAYIETIPALKHDYVVVLETPVTCIEAGKITSACTRCNNEKITMVSPIGHNYEAVVTAPTCDQAGYTTYTCPICADTYTADFTDAIGHQYSANWAWAEDNSKATIAIACQNANCQYNATPVTAEVTATCVVFDSTTTKEGRKEYTVRYEYNGESYSDVKIEIIPIVEHSHENCEWQFNKFNHWYKCQYSQGNSGKIPHEFDEGTVVKAADCLTDGEMLYKCECGYEKTEVIPSEMGHTPSEETKHDADKHWSICVNCGETCFVSAHEWKEEIQKENCTTAGTLIQSCECGEVVKTEIPAGHTEKVLEGKAATCTEDGLTEGKQCTVCSEITVAQEVIPAGHTYVDGVCTVCGEKEQTCTHTKLTRKTLNLSDYGACEGTLYYSICECGEVKTLDPESGYIGCDQQVVYQEQGIDENGNQYGIQKSVCSVCGMYFEVCQTLSEEGCKETYAISIILTLNDKVILDDITAEEIYEDHNSYFRDTIDLTEYGACGGTLTVRRCKDCNEVIAMENPSPACKIDLEHEPPFEEIVGEDGFTHSIGKVECPDCGFGILMDMWEETFSVCESVTHMVGRIYCKDTVIFELSEEDYRGGHQEERTYELLGETCKDGVKVIDTCTVCGQVEFYISSGHRETERVQIDLSEYGACNGILEGYRCSVCQQFADVYDYYINCNFEREDVLDDNGNVIGTKSTCSKCGLTIIEKSRLDESDPCETYECYEKYYYVGDQCIAEYGYRSYRESNHDFEYTYVFKDEANKNCEDGVSVTLRCRTCGITQRGYLTDHERLEEQRIDLTEYGACSGYIEITKCPCGQERHYSIHDHGNYDDYSSNTYVDDNGIEHTVMKDSCFTCGLVRVMDYYETTKGCVIYFYENDSVEINGEVIVTADSEGEMYANHDFEYTYEFYDEENKNCDDGVTVIATCRNCGETHESEYWYHITQQTQHIDLTEYGACYGSVSYYECPCGRESSVSVTHCAHSYSTYETYVDDNGVMHDVDHYSCSECGLVYIIDSYEAKEECVSYVYYNYRFEINGEVIGEFTEKENWGTSHNYVYTYIFDDENNKDCEAGVTVMRECLDCGEIYEDHQYYHRTYESVYNLSDYGAEGGYLLLYSCPCGKEQSMNVGFCYHGDSWSQNRYTDENGIEWYVETRTSACNCAIRYDRRYYYTYDTENCQRTTYYEVSLTVGDTLVKALTYERTETYHDYVVNGTLKEGATSCEDGVLITQKCRYCSDGYTNEYTWHHEYEKERIDLSEYGSVCGGDLVIEGCACGYYIHWNVYDAECDFDQKWTNNWIAGALDNSQETADGWNSFSSNSYIYTCSVTDPEQCGFVIRYSEYWLKNNDCSATQYLTIQFGYNEETNTWAGERTITLRTRTYHNYVYTSLNNGYKYECPDCGSYYTYCDYYNDGVHVKREEIYVNTLDDGCNKYREETYEYIDSYDNRWGYYTKSHFVKYIYANGEESWYKYEYSYTDYDAPFGEDSYVRFEKYTNSNGDERIDEEAYTYYAGYQFTLYDHRTEGDYWRNYDYTYNFEGGCKRTVVYTSSYGDNREYEEDAHPAWTYDTLKQPTCTQYGIYAHYCVLCHTSYDEVEISPISHNWITLPNGLYYCMNCGLQNINGATGDIVMEDLTEKYGNGEAYVIGYWMNTYVKFTPNVTIYLNTPIEIDGVPEEVFLLWLTDEQFHFVTDEYVGLYVNISDIEAAVQQLCTDLGIAALTPDMYAVRISFVPDGADSDFDYAITFDDLPGSEDIDYVIKDTEFITNYVPEGGYIEYTIVSDETAQWIFESYANGDTYAYLFDANGRQLAYNNDGANRGNNFRITYTLQAGVTYVLRVQWWFSYDAGYIPVFFEKGHTHTTEILPGYPASCTEGGYTDGERCIFCGVTVVAQKWIEPLRHKTSEWVETSAPTCTTDGEKRAVCSVCRETVIGSIPALGHNIKDGVCTVCGKTASCEEGHSYEVDPINNPQRFNATWGICTVCGYVDDYHEHILEGGKCKYCEDFELFELEVESIFDFDKDGANDKFTMGNALPEKFRAEGAYHISATRDVKAYVDSTTYDEIKAGSFTQLPYPHIYNRDTMKDSSYLLYEVNVDKAGVYDLAIHIRLKDGRYREAAITINDELALEYSYGWSNDSSATLDDTTSKLLSNDFLIGSYIYGFQVELKEGLNTIKITAPGATAKIQHIRDFYFVKVGETSDVPVDPDKPHEHAWGTEVTVVTAPTCITAGKGTVACNCGETKEVAIPATGDHNYVDGYCTVCGNIASCEDGHSYNNQITTVLAATCTEKGVGTYACLKCGATKEVIITPRHNLVDGKCTVEGCGFVPSRVDDVSAYDADKDGNLDVYYFTNALPMKFAGEDVYHIDAVEDILPSSIRGTNHTWYSEIVHGDADKNGFIMPFEHVYCDDTKAYDTQYLDYQIYVDEAGVYEMAIHLRLKLQYNYRGALYTINKGTVDEYTFGTTYDLNEEESITATDNALNLSTYMVGIKVTLKAGWNTIHIQNATSDITKKPQHFRNFYFVKVDDTPDVPVEPDTPHEHAWGTEVTVVTAPTCITAGKGTVACNCGETKEVAIPATGDHNYVDGYCTVCGKTASCEEGHSYEVDPINNPQRFNATWGICTVCGYVDDYHEHILEGGKCKYCDDFELFELEVESIFDFDKDGANDKFTMANALPEQFRGEGVVHVNAKQDSLTTAPHGIYDEVAAGRQPMMPYPHIYVSDTDKANSYLLYEIAVEEAGLYDLAIHVRLKDARFREAAITINDELALEYSYGWSESSSATLDDTTSKLLSNDFLIGSYIYGFQVELKEGVNTIKITAPGMVTKTQHLRDFYFVKVGETPDVPVDPDKPHEHAWGTEVTVVTAPTCITAGKGTVACNCGETKEVAIPATGDHNYVDGYCTVCGKTANCEDGHSYEIDLLNNPQRFNKTWGVCTVCDYVDDNHEHLVKDGKCVYCDYEFEYSEVASEFDVDGDGNKEVYFFAAALPEKFNDAIRVDAYKDNVSTGTFTVYDEINVNSARPGTYPDPMPYVYVNCTENKGHKLSYTVTVEKAGIYEMAVHVRIKDGQTRGAKYVFNADDPENKVEFVTTYGWATTDEATSVRNNDKLRGVYMYNIMVELKAGENTIDIYDATAEGIAKTQHLRDFYFVKVGETPDVPVDPDKPHEHAWGTEVTVVTAPTCITAGKGTVACNCGETKEVAIPATDDHNYVDGYCTVCGKTASCEDGHSYEVDPINNPQRFNATWGICTVCGYVDDYHEHILEGGKCKYCDGFELFELEVESIFDFDKDGANDKFTMANALPEKFRAEGVYHINAIRDVKTFVDSTTYDEIKAGSFTQLPYPHIYNNDGRKASSYLLYEVTVAEAGIYDLAIHVRLKDARFREAAITINDELALEYSYGWSESSSANLDDTTSKLLSNDFLIGSYIYGFQVELKEGVNTIKITAPGMVTKTQHLRDFYFVKVGETPDVPVDPDKPHEHAWGTEVTVVTAPTCITAGKGTVACNCGETKEVAIPATGDHNYVDGYCTVCGKTANCEDGHSYEIDLLNNPQRFNKTWGVCTVCDYVDDNHEHLVKDGKCVYCDYEFEYSEVTSEFDVDGDGNKEVYYFAAALPEKFNDAIRVDAYKDNVSTGAFTVYDEVNAGTNKYPDPMPYVHVYCTETRGQKLSYKVIVEEAGIYEMAVYLRIKDEKVRGVKYVFNADDPENKVEFVTTYGWATTDEATSVRNNDKLQGLYMYNIMVELKAGENTIDIYDATAEGIAKTQHIRDFYFVKVGETPDVPVDPDKPHEHAWGTEVTEVIAPTCITAGKGTVAE